MSFDAHKNFAVSTVATAPVPSTSGTSLIVNAGEGALFPTPPFNATIWSSIVANPLLSNAEIVRVTTISTDTFTIVRQQEGSSARSIQVGDKIAATITAKTLQDVESAVVGPIQASQITAGIVASQITSVSASTITGTIVGTIPGVYIPSNYTFSVAPGGTLASGSSVSVNLPGICPTGLSASDTNHWVCISGGSGTTEYVRITGGTASSGASGGTLIFATVAYTHTGAWTISSATAGIQEATNAACASGYINMQGAWVNLVGIYSIYAPIYVPGLVNFCGGVIQMMGPLNMVVFDVNVSGDYTVPNSFRDMTFYGGAYATGTAQTSGSCAIRIGHDTTTFCIVENCLFVYLYDCIVSINGYNLQIRHNQFLNFTHIAVTVGGSGDTAALQSTSNYYSCSFMSAPSYAAIYQTSGGAEISNDCIINNTNNQMQYGYYYSNASNSSGINITGGLIGYFENAGIYIATTGASGFVQYITITGVNIHNESWTGGASQGIVLSATGGAFVGDGIISGNVIQGESGTGYTGISLIGTTLITIGPNNITLQDGTSGTLVSGWWHDMALQNSWVADYYGGGFNPAYRLEGDVVRFKGGAKSGTYSDTTLLFTLPSGYIPNQNRVCFVNNYTDYGFHVAMLLINTSGAVTCYGFTSAYVQFDSVSFSLT